MVAIAAVAPGSILRGTSLVDVDHSHWRSLGHRFGDHVDDHIAAVGVWILVAMALRHCRGCHGEHHRGNNAELHVRVVLRAVVLLPSSGVGEYFWVVPYVVWWSFRFLSSTFEFSSSIPSACVTVVDRKICNLRGRKP